MTRTAIVPEQAAVEMLDAMRSALCAEHPLGPDYVAASTAMVNARPAVPDGLIEEAAKAIYCAATNSDPRCWRVYADHDEREQFRNMARAAARVFNGGKDE